MSNEELNSEIHAEIGRWLAGLRRRAGLSIESVSKRTGYSRMDIGGWERGAAVPLDALSTLLETFASSPTALVVTGLNERIKNCLLLALRERNLDIGQIKEILEISEIEAEHIFEAPFFVPVCWLVMVSAMLGVSSEVQSFMAEASSAIER